MVQLLHQLLNKSANRDPDKVAVFHDNKEMTYGQIFEKSKRLGQFLVDSGIQKGDRICFYLEKRFEKIISIFGISNAGGVIVPIRKLSRSNQVLHIINNSGARVLITTSSRIESLIGEIHKIPVLDIIISIGDFEDQADQNKIKLIKWDEIMDYHSVRSCGVNITETDLAAILYTSGSSGSPKGVILNHLNIIAGTKKVTEYLRIDENDRILSILTLGFDYGFNQLTSSFYSCSQLVLLDYLFPKDILHAVNKFKITGLAAVSATWIQLLQTSWDNTSMSNLRYISNSGGTIPKKYVAELRTRMPETDIFLMYGLTEAFRSTYLDPSLVDKYPTSIGKAIPGEEILVLDKKNNPVKTGQVGELVHRGVLVSQGYWGDPETTAIRFKKNPLQSESVPIPEMVVYSGDDVRIDDEGFLYFVGRKDEMIKCAGNRISPTEVEDILYSYGIVQDVVAFGIPHDIYGQSVFVVLSLKPDIDVGITEIKKKCRETMPPFMIPEKIEIWKKLIRNANGKIDRLSIKSKVFSELGIQKNIKP